MLRIPSKAFASAAFLAIAALGSSALAQPKSSKGQTPKIPPPPASASAPALPEAPPPPPASTPEPPPPPPSATAEDLPPSPPPPASAPILNLPPPVFQAPPPGDYPLPYYYPGYPGYPQHYFQIEPAEYKVKPKEWYGWQTIIVHGISLVTLLLSAAGEGTPAPVTVPLGMGGFLFGAPIVHWAHGYVGKGFGSLGLVLGGTVGGYLMTATTACVTGLCEGGGGYGALYAFFLAGPIGGGLTLLAMNIVDYATLAYEEGGGPLPQTLPSPKDSAPKWSMQPILDIQRDRAVLGLGGLF